MTNNDVLRRVRFIFNIGDAGMMEIFRLGGYAATREQISDWLKRDDDPAFSACGDKQLTAFLNGLITVKRGEKEGFQPVPVKQLNNNIVFMKLKIAMNLKAEEVLDMLKLAGFPLSKHELSAFFRKPDHKHYRECKDQILRNFLKGAQLTYRPDA